MKKWEQLQLTLDNPKSEDRHGDFKDKTQNLFMTTRVRVIKCEIVRLTNEIECLQQWFA